MRFFSALVTAASVALVSAQEALRFGILHYSPTGPLTPNEVITVNYNSTPAFNQPLFVDFYLAGKFSNGNAAPNLLLSRNTYGASQTLLAQNETLPDFTFLGDVTYVVWASVIYSQDGLTEIGGVEGLDV